MAICYAQKYPPLLKSFSLPVTPAGLPREIFSQLSLVVLGEIAEIPGRHPGKP